MDKERMISIAKIVIQKNLNYEELYYSDFMYGIEKMTDEVWEYVEEAKEIGMGCFNRKYYHILNKI